MPRHLDEFRAFLDAAITWAEREIAAAIASDHRHEACFDETYRETKRVDVPLWPHDARALAVHLVCGVMQELHAANGTTHFSDPPAESSEVTHG